MTHNFRRSYLNARVGRIEQIGGITPIIYDDGRARGTRGFLVRSGGGLEFECIVDRALDIASASYRGIPLAWHAPGGIAHPAYYAPVGKEFERNFFGGFVTTCGLNAFGPPGEDRWGAWGQHGRVNHLPAQNVTHRLRWDDDEHGTLEIAGTVLEYVMFGEALRLERTWRIGLGTNRLELTDRVTNDGGIRMPHMLLYHCNAGFPLLDAESTLTLRGAVRPRDEEAQGGLDRWGSGGPPQPDFKEQVFLHDPLAGADGFATAAFHNPTLCNGDGVTLAVRFRMDTLPAFFSWRLLGHKTYVMGMEPANCPTIEGREEAHRRGTLPFLEPGETREYALHFEIY